MRGPSAPPFRGFAPHPALRATFPDGEKMSPNRGGISSPQGGRGYKIEILAEG